MEPNNDVWQFQNDDQLKKMTEHVTPENCGEKLKLIRGISGLSRIDLAKSIGCSESTITRLELKKSLPTTDFMLRLAALSMIGYAKYSKMSDKDKKNISETIIASGGVIAGVGGAIGVISVSGTVAGLSAAGITSGLAAIGGTMLGGLAVVTTLPLAAGFAGYGLVKGIQAICKANKLSCKEVDGEFEISREQLIGQNEVE